MTRILLTACAFAALLSGITVSNIAKGMSVAVESVIVDVTSFEYAIY